VPTLHRCAEFGRMHVHGGLKFPELERLMSEEELIEAFARASSSASRCAFVAAAARISTAGRGSGELLDTRGHAGIVSYEPTELVVTARCGTPLAELESALAARRQFLACEPPHFGAATVGGAVAAGLSGPRRAAVGSLRDFVLGVKLMDGEGRVLASAAR
jgi:glycolate oxidase FAD binding subunit